MKAKLTKTLEYHDIPLLEELQTDDSYGLAMALPDNSFGIKDFPYLVVLLNEDELTRYKSKEVDLRTLFLTSNSQKYYVYGIYDVSDEKGNVELKPVLKESIKEEHLPLTYDFYHEGEVGTYPE